MLMFCGQCGHRVSVSDRFCVKCGSPLSNSPAAESPREKETIVVDEQQRDKPQARAAHTDWDQVSFRKVRGPTHSRLWNPTRVWLTSLVLTPVFGTILVMLNWRELGDSRRANEGWIWIAGWMTLYLFGPWAATSFAIAQQDPTVLDAYRGVGPLAFILWVFLYCRPNKKAILSSCPDGHKERSWGKPLLIAVPLAVVFWLSITVYGLMVTKHQNLRMSQNGVIAEEVLADVRRNALATGSMAGRVRGGEVIGRDVQQNPSLPFSGWTRSKCYSLGVSLGKAREVEHLKPEILTGRPGDPFPDDAGGGGTFWYYYLGNLVGAIDRLDEMSNAEIREEWARTCRGKLAQLPLIG